MKRLFFLPVLLALVTVLSAFGGCASAPQNAQQGIFQVKQNYELALQVAVSYDALPACTTPTTIVVCSDTAIVKKLKQAKDVASPAVQAAENAVRDPNFDKSTTDAVVASANQAVLALTAIVAILPKPTHP